MYKVKNLLNIPQTVNLVKRSIHFLPKGEEEINAEEFKSIELKNKIRSKFISADLIQKEVKQKISKSKEN